MSMTTVTTSRIPVAALRGERPVRLTPVRCSPGAVRSYTSVAPRGRFVVDCMTKLDRTTRDGWRVSDRATGVVETCWNLKGCLGIIRLLLAPPAPTEPRFVVLNMPADAMTGEDCVLYDRVTGQWWPRVRSFQLNEDVKAMTGLVASLPGEYNVRRPVTYVPAQ